MSSRTGDLLPRLAAGMLVLLACGWTAVNLRARFAPRHHPPSVPAGTLSAQRPAYEGGHAIAAPSAKLQVIVFSDYQCPACRGLWKETGWLTRRRRDSVGIVIRQYPLSSHPLAMHSAIAAECAAAQGKFAAYHDELFAHQAILADTEWVSHAVAAGVSDTARFRICLAGAAAAAAVRRDIQAGDAIAVDATPTLIIGNDVYRGVPWDLDEIISNHLRSNP